MAILNFSQPPPLPYAAFTASHTNAGSSLGEWQCLGKYNFDQPPSGCEVGVIGRKFNDTMKMLWQNYPAVDDERMTLTYRSHRVAQQADMPGSADHYSACAADLR